MSGTDTEGHSPSAQDSSATDGDDQDPSEPDEEVAPGEVHSSQIGAGERRAGTVAKIALWGLAGSLAGLLATGVPLIWQYDPTRHMILRDLHTFASGVFVMAALLLLGAAVVSRIRRWPTREGWLAALLVFGLSQAAGVSGLLVAWDNLFLDRGSSLPRSGILTAMRPEVQLVLADGETFTPSDYKAIAAAHLVIIPLAIVVTYVFNRRWSRAAEPRVT